MDVGGYAPTLDQPFVQSAPLRRSAPLQRPVPLCNLPRCGDLPFTGSALL